MHHLASTEVDIFTSFLFCSHRMAARDVTTFCDFRFTISVFCFFSPNLIYVEHTLCFTRDLYQTKVCSTYVRFEEKSKKTEISNRKSQNVVTSRAAIRWLQKRNEIKISTSVDCRWCTKNYCEILGMVQVPCKT